MDLLTSERFTSFRNEQEVWDQWFENNPNKINTLDPFFLSEERINAAIEKEVLFYLKKSDTFLLTMSINIDNGIFTITILSRVKDKWTQIAWIEKEYYGEFEKIVRPFEGLSDKLLRKISHKRFYYSSDQYTVDATSVYFFLKYRGLYSRYAIYNVYPSITVGLTRFFQAGFFPARLKKVLKEIDHSE